MGLTILGWWTENDEFIPYIPDAQENSSDKNQEENN